MSYQGNRIYQPTPSQGPPLFRLVEHTYCYGKQLQQKPVVKSTTRKLEQIKTQHNKPSSQCQHAEHTTYLLLRTEFKNNVSVGLTTRELEQTITFLYFGMQATLCRLLNTRIMLLLLGQLPGNYNRSGHTTTYSTAVSWKRKTTSNQECSSTFS